MPKKRTSTSSSNDEQTTKGSDCELMQAVFQHEDNIKRAKRVSLSDTTLQDLPIELIECILVKVVAMEVKSMKLAKRLWKVKADLVINRLKTVSVQWSSILTTNCFRTKLHRALDGTAQETIRWEILHQPFIQRSFVIKMTTLKDEVFMLCMQYKLPYDEGDVLKVYHRNNLVKPKNVIPLPEFYLRDMAACNVSNCVYVLNEDEPGHSITRITKDEHQFKMAVWIKNLRLPVSYYMSRTLISVAANGSLVILYRPPSPDPSVVSIYDANAVVQHKLRLSPAVYGVGYVGSVIQKSNGNLLLVSGKRAFDFDPTIPRETKLVEIEMSGKIIREYQASLRIHGAKIFEDIYGRILVNDLDSRVELLDSELNHLDLAVLQLDGGQPLCVYKMDYNSERHEMVGVCYDRNTETNALVTIRFREE